MRVLIADDSQVMREHLIITFSSYSNIEIIAEAEDSLETIKSISKTKPDVVILDVRMPGGGGIHVLKTIKKKTNCTPIIVVFTNYPYPQYRKKCLEEGAEFFFDKLTESEKMIETIDSLSSKFSAP